MRHLTTTKTQRHFDFVALIQKALDIAHLDLVIAFVSARAQLDFFDFNNRLLGLGVLLFFLLLVFEFAVVDQPANWGISRRCNFDQIHIHITSHTQGLGQTHHAHGLVIRPRNPHFRRSNLAIQTVLTRLAVIARRPRRARWARRGWGIGFGNDGSILLKNT